MSKVSNMSMAEIFNKVDIKFKLDDLPKICTNSEQANRFRALIETGKNHIEVMIDNEEYIDKEKMLLVTWLSYRDDISELKNKLAGDILRNGNSRARIEQEIRDMSNCMQKIKKICRDVDTYLVVVHLKDELVDEIEIISSREEILGYDFSDTEKKNRKIFEYIDNTLSVEPGDLGMKYALQTVELEDFEKAMPYEIAQAVKYMIEFNNMKLGERFAERFLEKKEKEEDTSELNDEFQQEVSLPTVRNAVNEVLRYVDLKKLLLIEIYRIEYELDKVFSKGESISKERLHAAENVASFLLDIIGKDTVLENGDSTYSYEDVLFFLDRINAERNIYITRTEAINLRNQLLQGWDIEEIEDEDLDKLCMLRYTSEELDSIMHISQANFTFGMTMQDLSEEQIIQRAHQYKGKWSKELTDHFFSEGKLSITSILELYYDGIISAESLKEFSEENDISSEINLEKIQTLYTQIKKQKEPDEKDIKKLDSMVALYKMINFDDKEDQEKEKIYSEVIDIIESEEDIVFYFEKGLSTLQTVADLSGELAVKKLYSESKITFEDVENLDIDVKSKQLILRESIMSKVEEYDEATLLEYINKGYLSEEDIFRIFELDILHKTYADDMLVAGIISPKTAIKIDDISVEKKEKQAGVKLGSLQTMEEREFLLEIINEEKMESSKLSLGSVPTTKKRDSEEKEEDDGRGGTPGPGGKPTESLIDPRAREMFLKALGCKIPKDEGINNQDPESPFYNYEFFVIENNSSDAQKGSIVIAERFYEDKFKKGDYATSNATYVWEYTDYLTTRRIMNLEQKRSKRAVLEETAGVVYVANHRPGSWAVSLLYKIAQASAGESFKKYKKGDERATKVLEELEKLYSPERLNAILDLAGMIDDRWVMPTKEGKEVPIVYDVIKETKRMVNRKGSGNGEER